MKTRMSTNRADPLVGFFKRFHVIVFFLVVSVCLFFAILLLLPIINQPTDGSKASGQAVDGAFDQATIDRLRDNNPANSSQPGERSSPFTE